MVYVLIAASAYLLGTIPFGYLLVKFFRGEDIRLSGSGNIGATNVVRSGAKALGIATLVLDALKGLLAVSFASIIGNSSYNQCADGTCVPLIRLMSLAALAAVLGHMFPVWLRFRGGKGVATAIGAFALLFPHALLLAIVLFVVVVAVTRYVSLGSILAALLFPIFVWRVEQAPWRSMMLVASVSVLIIAKHHQNIQRLMAGSENRFGGAKSPIREKQA